MIQADIRHDEEEVMEQVPLGRGVTKLECGECPTLACALARNTQPGY